VTEHQFRIVMVGIALACAMAAATLAREAVCADKYDMLLMIVLGVVSGCTATTAGLSWLYEWWPNR